MQNQQQYAHVCPAVSVRT